MQINIVKNGKYFFMVSMLLLVLSIFAISFLGLKYGIDFTGGSVLVYQSNKSFTNGQIQEGIDLKKFSPFQIQNISANTYQISTKPLDQTDLKTLEDALDKNFNQKAASQVNTVGPSIGNLLRQDALQAIIYVSLAIIIYIAWAFRSVRKPVSSWSFGVTAVVAMAHDVIIVLGAFALLGFFFGAQIDTLFVTAILTVIGFSVHDTIVVFDRIRENMLKNTADPFPVVVNNSLLETLARSVNTSLTVILTLTALFLLGGESIRWFVLALLIGITSGTYSSIFVASQALVLYQNFKNRENTLY